MGTTLSNPNPDDLDVENAARQIEELYECENPSNIEATFLHGSFANPEKPVDRNNYESDVDIFFILNDDNGAEPTLNPFSKVPTITLKFKNEKYEYRAIDTLCGTYSSFMNSSDPVYKELPVSLKYSI